MYLYYSYRIVFNFLFSINLHFYFIKYIFQFLNLRFLILQILIEFFSRIKFLRCKKLKIESEKRN